MKKGFTLIELLAVIVILAIIALIATPIVLNIISDAKESAQLRSAEMYLKGVELSIGKSSLNGQVINNGLYKTMSDGNICLRYQEDAETCMDKLEVGVNGETPKEDSIVTIVDGKIEAVRLKYGEKEIVTDENKNLIYCDYKIGEEVTFNPGDENRTWNVIDEDATTVTLILSKNLGRRIAWYENIDSNSNGPVTALNYLNTLTTNWNNVDPIESYTYINNLNGTAKPYGYQKLEIKNGVATLTNKSGETKNEVSGISKARLLTIEEVLEIASKTNINLTEDNLRNFIQRNLSAINTKLGTSLTTVDQVISLKEQEMQWLMNESQYHKTYQIVGIMIREHEIEKTYDVLLPSYLYQDLSSSTAFAYWTLSAYNPNRAWAVGYSGIIYKTTDNSDCVWQTSLFGIRPVITIPKSKLTK